MGSILVGAVSILSSSLDTVYIADSYQVRICSGTVWICVRLRMIRHDGQSTKDFVFPTWLDRS